MKKILPLICFLFPVLSFCQDTSYSVRFDDLINGPDDSIKLLKKMTIIITPSDAASLEKAKIIITGIPKKEEHNNIKLAFASDSSKVIAEEAQNNDSTTLVFNVKNVVEQANGIFRVFYKDKSKGRFQFNIKKEKKSGTGGGEDKDNLTAYIGALANANFIGNNKFLANLTPIVTLGAVIDVTPDKKNFNYSIDVNPYIGAQIDTKDSASFIPSLMLPGRAGLIFNNYFSWSNDDIQFTFMPLGFGLKLIPNVMDSNTVIWQHNFRTGISFEYINKFLLGFQYTYGFHNTTSESQQFYSKVFSKKTTDISYFTLTGQFLVKNTEEVKNYLFIEWRGLVSKKKYEPFTNNSILTFGIRKDLARTHTFPVSETNSRRKSRPSIF